MNPYEHLDDNYFWKPAVASKSMFDITKLWEPKFHLKPHHKIVTFGSCFAQHIGNRLQSNGYNWLSNELPPKSLTKAKAKEYNYNIFSCRTGNIYTTSLLKQWIKWATNKSTPPTEIWEKDNRFYDPFRPRIEPRGFSSKDELRKSRLLTISRFKDSIEQSNFFIFTLGLTESWKNKSLNYEYPMCPGTVAGKYNEKEHVFSNQQFLEIINNLIDCIDMMTAMNSNIKIILTVSPVPLTATMSNKHILVATMESKSILRAVAGQLAANRSNVDYFPSYEIINSPVFKGCFFEPNQRSVNQHGVNFVMNSFFTCMNDKFGANKKAPLKTVNTGSDEMCEEHLLEVFLK